MAGPEQEQQTPREPRADTKPAWSVPRLVTFVVTSSAIVLVAMMFATGVAQRAASPHIDALFARTGGKPIPEPQPRAEAADTAATPGPVGAPPWSAETDSLSLLRQQIAIAMDELDASRDHIDGLDASRAHPVEESPTAGEASVAARTSPADSAAHRDLVRLVKVLDAMKPDAAARVLNSVDDALAVEAIRRLRERQAGRILALLNAEKAATVSLALGRGAERIP